MRYRRAIEDDLPAIITLLADDVLGSSRESLTPAMSSSYRSAFAEIEADPNQFLCVVEDNQEVIGTLQLTFIPGLARSGAKRGQIEAVRVASARRGENIGEGMLAWAIEQCRTRGCAIVQLTTDKERPDAHRFYDHLGFKATHVGYKMQL